MNEISGKELVEWFGKDNALERVLEFMVRADRKIFDLEQKVKQLEKKKKNFWWWWNK